MGIVILSLLLLGKRDMANDESSVSDGESSTSEATAKLENMEYSEVEGGKIQWTLRADVARYFKEKDITEMENVHVTFYMEDGSCIEVNGDRGIIHAGIKDIELIGNVTSILPGGYRVRTDHVYYSHGKKEIYSDTPLLIFGSELQGQANQWSYDLNTRKGYAKNGVDVLWHIELSNATH